MRPFTLERARSVEAAAMAAVGHSEVKFIAGGTNLLDLMKLQIEAPAHLIDVNHLPLDRIEHADDGGLRIGALVRNADLAAHAQVRRRYPLLSQALLAGASAQLRNRATTAGNLLQRTRCAYFYDTGKACNKRAPGTGCAALQGYNRMHAIVGASEACIAVHPSDMAVAMRALDARIEVAGAGGQQRSIPIAEFHRLPGDTPQIETSLRAGELITAVTLPSPPPGVQRYRKIRDRASYAFALVSIAAVIDGGNGRIRSARLAFGGLAHRPWRVDAAERLLDDAPATPERFDAVADAVLAGARGYGHNDFKIPLLRRSLHAMLAQAAA
jgi:xanthine dehydrogenase YagS FAD-binding subunit